MPLINRYTTTTKGAMTFTGNTLGLSNNNLDVGAFTTLDTSQQVAGFPAGTTSLWQNNQSSAQLNIPAGSTVLYAELQWGGTFNSSVSSSLNTPITFSTPSGTYTISPDPITALQGTNFYSRSQDVTSIIQSSGNGTYTVGGVPAAINSIIDTAGWTLGIIYENPSLPAQNMSIYSGVEEIIAGAPPIDFNLSGFITPITGPVNGRVLISAMEGDSAISGDQLLFGPTAGTVTPLSGPNNLVGNFFGAQINNASSVSPNVGLLDTSGTFGSINVPTNLPARYGWDITNVLSSNFTNLQTSAVVRLTSTGDGYAVPLMGIQLDALLTDFGDAPNTNTSTQGTNNYRTLFASNGPYHILNDNLTLGAQITSEIDAYPNAFATGDDLSKNIPDDGTILPLTNMALNAPTYSITESVFNNTGQNAHVYAWIDFNKNGIFETNEGTNLSVPSSASFQNINLTFTVPATTVLTPGQTFVRVRLTTDTLVNTGGATSEDTRSFGIATNGEVEDYELVIENTRIISTKTVDKQYADVGDTLTYTVTLQNPGTIAIPNVVFRDTLPSGVSYANSLNVNSIYIGVDPMNGLTLPSISAGQTVTISWLVIVNSTVPSINPVSNTGNILIPSLPSTGTNTVTTQVNNATLIATKSANKQIALVGETITYTVTITNSGNVSANPATVTDIIPSGTTYISNTLLVDGVSNPSNPVTGIDISPVLAGQSKVIVYSVIVNSDFQTLPLSNTALVEYKYIVDPNQPPVSKEGKSNTVNVDVADIRVVKATDKAYAQVGDTITYTNIITNTGNTTITNIIFSDTPPANTTYINPSLTIDGVLYPSIDPNAPINIGVVAPSVLPFLPGDSITVKYKVTIDTIPSNPVILNTSSSNFEYIDGTQTKTGTKGSNQVTTIVREGRVELTKSADKTIVEVGDTITYTIVAKNSGNVEVGNVVIVDTLPSQVSFVTSSVIVGGISKPSDSPLTGIYVGSIPAQTSITTRFLAVVTTLPPSGQISNTSSSKYTVIIDPSLPAVTKTSNSNTVTIDVKNVALSVIKQCSPKTVKLGDTITYVFIISNVGNVTITDAKFYDTLPNSVAFVDGSFVGSSQISVTSKDLVTGVTIGDIGVNTQKTINFNVILNSNSCPPTVTNQGFVNYQYQLFVGQNLTKTNTSNNCSVNIINSSFKQIYKDGKLTIPPQKPDIEDILDISVTSSTINSELISSPKGVSQDGQILTGKKLLICTMFNISVQYVASLSNQSVHTANYKVSSCEYLVVPENMNENCCSGFKTYIEDIYYEKLSNRELFYNITYLINSLC